MSTIHPEMISILSVKVFKSNFETTDEYLNKPEKPSGVEIKLGQNTAYNLEEKNGIEIFSARDYRSEIYEIIKRIVSQKSLADDTHIIYTNSNPYLYVIHDLIEKINTPATFSVGIGADKSIAGKSLKCFLMWIKDDFYEMHLRKLLKYNYLKLENAEFGYITGQSLAHIWHLPVFR